MGIIMWLKKTAKTTATETTKSAWDKLFMEFFFNFLFPFNEIIYVQSASFVCMLKWCMGSFLDKSIVLSVWQAAVCI